MNQHKRRCHESALRLMKSLDDERPTLEEIWGPRDPETGNHMGGGLAEYERRSRPDKADEAKKVALRMLPYGRGKLIGNE